MATNTVIMPLAKVIIAAAWVDGQIGYQELNSLKDLLFHLPDMEAKDWTELEIYLETPVGDEERQRLVAELQSAIANPADKGLALHTLDELVLADGRITSEEKAALEEIKTSIDTSSNGFFSRLGLAVRGSASRRSRDLGDLPNREHYIQDFVHNRIYYLLRYGESEANLGAEIPESELRLLSLAGGLMARVAFVDRKISAQEQGAIEQALQEHWKLSAAQAAVVREVAGEQISKDLDYYRLSREFFESTSEAQRTAFLDVLFAIASSDSRVSNEELEEIRTISIGLKLTHAQFIEAKLRVPSELRAI